MKSRTNQRDLYL